MSILLLEQMVIGEPEIKNGGPGTTQNFDLSPDSWNFLMRDSHAVCLLKMNMESCFCELSATSFSVFGERSPRPVHLVGAARSRARVRADQPSGRSTSAPIIRAFAWGDRHAGFAARRNSRRTVRVPDDALTPRYLMRRPSWRDAVVSLASTDVAHRSARNASIPYAAAIKTRRRA
jgi:hypothetical protein